MSSATELVFINGTVVLPDALVADGFVACRDGVIAETGRRDGARDFGGAREVDAGGGYICPGYVDLHVHGGGGADYMDGTAAAVRTVNRAHARHGTTTIFPTTTTGAPGQIRAMLEACREVKESWGAGDGARIAGVHFYGPYFAAEKTGCHSRGGRRDPDPAEYAPELKKGLIRIATCAAELPGAAAFYEAAFRQGCLTTCGHSNASWTEMERAFEAGVRHVDHFWCAMSSVPSMRARFGTPTQGSMEQFVLMEREMSTEIIADGCHLAPELMEFAFVMKGADRLCLVTDANRALDKGPGRYRFGPESDGEWFMSDGRVGYLEGGGLASSVRGMDHMVRTMSRLKRVGLAGAVRMASLTPAERTGMSSAIGSIERGKRADILTLNSALEVERVFLGGIEFEMNRGAASDGSFANRSEETPL